MTGQKHTNQNIEIRTKELNDDQNTLKGTNKEMTEV